MPIQNTTASQYNAMAAEASIDAALVDLQPNPDTYQALHQDLSNTSRVSRWRLLLAVVAYHIKLLRDQWELYNLDVRELAKDGHYGTRRWFVSKALAYQAGDVLTLTDKDAAYPVDHPAARIVKKAACIELANRVVVKVAKAQGSGLAKLTAGEAAGVQAYFNVLRPPVQVSVLTADADLLRMYGAVVFDAQYPVAGIQASLTLAVRTYLRTLDFGGYMRLTDLRKAILAVPGVVDVRLNEVQCRSTGGWITTPRIYAAYAGHMDLDQAFPLSATLTWSAGTV